MPNSPLRREWTYLIGSTGLDYTGGVCALYPARLRERISDGGFDGATDDEHLPASLGTGLITVSIEPRPVSVHAAGFDHRVYVFFAVLTHAAVGYTLVSVLTDDHPAVGVVGGVLPDVDLLFAPSWTFPFVHRGVTHTLLFVGVVAGAALASDAARWAARGAALGLVSHLVVDTFTRSGVRWLYPLSRDAVAVDASIHSPGPSVLLWSLLLSALLFRRRRARRADRTPDR